MGAARETKKTQEERVNSENRGYSFLSLLYTLLLLFLFLDLSSLSFLYLHICPSSLLVSFILFSPSCSPSFSLLSSSTALFTLLSLSLSSAPPLLLLSVNETTTTHEARSWHPKRAWAVQVALGDEAAPTALARVVQAWSKRRQGRLHRP